MNKLTASTLRTKITIFLTTTTMNITNLQCSFHIFIIAGNEPRAP